jgi:hypothetical protein
MSDHSIATRRYAFLTPGSFAAWARRSHSSALALCSWALDGISSGPRLAFPDRLNPLGADWFHSCDGLPVSFGTACALYGLRRKENASRFRTIQVSLRTCHSVGGKLKTAGKPTLLVMVARTREPGHALPEAAALHNAPRRRGGGWPLAARAQQPYRMRRMGFLVGNAEDHEAQSWVAAFREELGKLGWTEGRNIEINIRWAAADVALMKRFAKELVALQPDLMVTPRPPPRRCWNNHVPSPSSSCWLPILSAAATSRPCRGQAATRLVLRQL